MLKALNSVVIIIVLMMPTQFVFAAGGGDSNTTQTVPAKSSAYQRGQKALDARDWNKAINEFKIDLAKHPKNVDALNYLGYAYRQKSDYDKAFEYYRQALVLNNGHRGANEYIGEAYLKTGNLQKAEFHLARLDNICTFGCAEYTMLKRAVEKYKATH